MVGGWDLLGSGFGGRERVRGPLHQSPLHLSLACSPLFSPGPLSVQGRGYEEESDPQLRRLVWRGEYSAAEVLGRLRVFPMPGGLLASTSIPASIFYPAPTIPFPPLRSATMAPLQTALSSLRRKGSAS
jgi:hypothetical protein